jgi:hypothetical protein
MLEIRKPTMDELNEIMKIYRIARDFMIKTGPPKKSFHSCIYFLNAFRHPLSELTLCNLISFDNI